MTYLVLFKFWREILIGLLAFLLIICLGLLNNKVGQLKQSESQCTTKIQKLKDDQQKALIKKQNEINKVSADYEQLKSEQRVKVETITRKVQKIVTKPIYSNVCIDDDGVQQLNSLITDSSS